MSYKKEPLDKGFLALAVIGIPLSIGVAWLAAIAGEPRAQWMFCTLWELC